MTTVHDNGDGSTNKKDLACLDDFQLFSILLAHLYMKYDHGGYSCMRSVQSDAIEFRVFIPHCGFAQEYAGNLMHEVKRRIETSQQPTELPLQLTFDLGPCTLTTEELVQYCLKNLAWWYDHCAEQNGFLDAESPRIVKFLYALHLKFYGDLLGNVKLSLATLYTLIQEIDRRVIVYLAEKYKLHDFETLHAH